MAKKTLAALLVALLPVAAHAADHRWLHVTVDGDEETVRIHLPMTVVSAALPLLEEHGFCGGHLRIDDHEIDREELIKIVTALKAAQDGEYVTVDNHEDHVRVTKKGKFLYVQAQERQHEKHSRHREAVEGNHVEVKIPLDVAEALLAGPGEELDLMAALDKLAKYEDTDLVTVKDDGETVRIWIDRKPAS